VSCDVSNSASCCLGGANPRSKTVSESLDTIVSQSPAEVLRPSLMACIQ
jgi:hypothetical protein